MSFVVVATYVVKEGEAGAVDAALRQMLEPTRSEPGCVEYRVHHSVDDPNVFFLFEEYVDEDGYNAHAASPHFEEHIIGVCRPRLEERIVVRGNPID